jgi:hypothetical protein
MFKKSVPDNQADLFGNVSANLVGKAQKLYNKDNAWHNLFRTQIIQRIDEEPYGVLFSERMGAPNASICTLIGMMVLKEAFGWSDQELFEQCRFNLLVRSAVGFNNITDELPGESTYYLLRKRIFDFRELSGRDLLQETFDTITSGQIKDFKVNGRSIRMDSKLIGSNIAYYSRYEIVHQSMCVFYKTLDKKALSLFTRPIRLQLSEVFQEDPGKTVYLSSREQIKTRLHLMGGLICRMLKYLKKRQDTQQYQLLQRVFDENYVVVDKLQVELRPNKQMSSSSVQSPHDPDAAYRDKGGNNKVKGYSVNITETTTADEAKPEDSLNLITNAIVDKANVQDLEFVQPAIEATRKITCQTVEKAHMDGAYQSPRNAKFCQDIDMVFTGIQGEASRYDLDLTPEGLLVTDTKTGEQILAKEAKRLKEHQGTKWVIKNEKGYRYFDERHIRVTQLRRTLQKRPIEELRKRNNVEATIFHFAHRLRNNKSKYRGLTKQQAWANCRCLWINLVRIMKFVQKTCQRTFNSMQKGADISLLLQKYANILNVCRKYQPNLASI